MKGLPCPVMLSGRPWLGISPKKMDDDGVFDCSFIFVFLAIMRIDSLIFVCHLFCTLSEFIQHLCISDYLLVGRSGGWGMRQLNKHCVKYHVADILLFLRQSSEYEANQGGRLVNSDTKQVNGLASQVCYEAS